MRLLLFTCLLLSLCGCSATNVTKIVTAFGKDHATWVVRVMTPYGSGTYVRVGDSTNSTTTVSPDGSITQRPLSSILPAQ